jgi:hypothetical protein
LPQWSFGSFPFLPHDRVRQDFLLISTERQRARARASNMKERRSYKAREKESWQSNRKRD